MSKSCIIIGGGMAGCVSALVLTRLGIKCKIYELRDVPATIGGAVNLTPNALKIFKDLKIDAPGCVVDNIEIFSYYSGSKIGNLPFTGPTGPSLRVVREKLLKALLDAVEKAGVEVVYGSKLVAVVDESDTEEVVAEFENGNSAKGDFIVGCDGMFSAVRLKYVEPERVPIYTGVCSAYTLVDASNIKSPIHFQQTAVNAGRCDADCRARLEEGWRARGLDHEKTVAEVDRRYGHSAFPCLKEMTANVKEYIFYPVYKLEPGGKWWRGRVVLLGDAAHGMPPQGESTGLAIEDGVLLARVFEKFPDQLLSSVYESYEKTRRRRIDIAYKDTMARWEKVRDKTWLWQTFEEWVTWIYMWYKSDDFQKSFAYDVTKEEIVT